MFICGKHAKEKEIGKGGNTFPGHCGVETVGAWGLETDKKKERQTVQVPASLRQEYFILNLTDTTHPNLQNVVARQSKF